MKRLLTRTARAHAAERLTQGSVLVCRRRTAGILRWIRAGRRTDLTGWRAALGPIARLALVGLLAWIAYSIVRAVPWLLGLLVALWCHAAWKASRGLPGRAPEADRSAPAGPTPEDVRAATLDWVWQLIGDAQGVHLRDLLEHAQSHGMFAALDVTAFRAHLERWGIPVRARVRVRGLGVTVGIHRDDLQAPATASPEQPPQEPAETELHPS